MPAKEAFAHRRLCIALAICQGVLVFALLGALACIIVFFGVQRCDLLSADEIAASSASPDLVPKLIHQTWRDDKLPDRWAAVSEECQRMHPDYEYRLWTDASARAFIAESYPTFLELYDGYEYPIQRADAMRYFILHEFGGIYLDMDVGCKKSLDPLLKFEVVLPQTKPVGISNDVILATPHHAFMEAAIESLSSFDHSYLIKYATVMLSTGPMFLSAVYAAFTEPGSGVRVLPRAMYGKYTGDENEEQAYFAHYFASSWHGQDAGFVVFLGKYGLYALYVFLACGAIYFARYLHLRHRERRLALLDAEDEEKRDPLLFEYSPLSQSNTPLPPASPQPPAFLGGSRRSSLASADALLLSPYPSTSAVKSD